MAKVGLAASPPIPAPRPLRPFVRFAKLSDRAVATVRRVLDDDEAFRTRVCATIDLAGLEDELDEPSLLFLRRPADWEGALQSIAARAAEAEATEAAARADARAARRLEATQAALERAEVELGALRETVASLRAEVAEERRARHTASSDLGRLRQRLAELEAADDVEHPEGEAPADAAATRARAEEAEARAERACERADAAEQARLEAEAKAALAAAEARAALAVTAATGEPAPVDHHAVSAAVASAVAAVGSLAEALGRAAEALGSTEPAPGGETRGAHGPVPAGVDRRRAGRRRSQPSGGRVPVPLPPAVFDDTVEAAEHLLRVPGALVLVDGYNVTLAARGDLPLADQRRWLLDAAAGTAARTGAAFQVVFDGDDGASAPAERSRRLGVQVRFTAADVEADDVLLELLAALPVEQPAVVVSDDHRVRDGARRLGANLVGAHQLVDALRR